MPASADAERSILGGILLENDHFYDDLADLNEEDFSLDSHRKIYAAMYSILFGLEEGITRVDLVTLIDVLGKRKQVGVIGGAAYIASLTENLPRRVSVAEYVSIVKEKARLRRLIHMANSVSKRAVDQVESAGKIAADLQDDLIEESAEGSSDAVRIGDITTAVEEKVERGRNMAIDRTAAELTWGVEGLDAFTKGAFSGDLTVVAGESGGFKTAFATQMVVANAREGKPCAIYSIEMLKLLLTERCYPVMGKIITTQMMRDPRLINLHTHMPEIRRLSAELKKLPLWIDDAKQPINRLIARMRMMVRKHGIKLFVIDYFQLIIPNEAKTEAEGLKGIAFALRDFMKVEPSTHVVLLSQYAKSSGAARKGKQRRTREDLYGTSALHHAAQNVLLVGVESAKGKEPNCYLDAEFDFDKSRSGGTGIVEGIMLDPSHMRFMHPQPYLQS